MFFTGDGPVQLFVNVTVPGIKTAISDHLVMLFRDMLDEALYEFHNRNGFFHVFVIFMTVVVESNKIPIIFINP